MKMIADYTAEDLLLRAVRFHVKYRPRLKPAWSALKRPFGLGSSRSVDLCLAAGLDPDTGEPLDPKEGISCGHARGVETPWWEPRPWGDKGPSPEEIPQDEEGERRIDVFEPGLSAGRWSSAGWYEAKWRAGRWSWSDSVYPVTTATHWHPKGPAPEVEP